MNRIENTTLCYPELDGCYLMLHRTKKENDINEGKWIGIGGHMEPGESPEDCIRREMHEETGFTADTLRFRGIVTFVYRDTTEYMYLFTAAGLKGTEARPVTIADQLPPCPEGDLAWVPVAEASDRPVWEGDRIFLKLLSENTPFFSLKLVYDAAGALIQAVLNEKPVGFSV